MVVVSSFVLEEIELGVFVFVFSKYILYRMTGFIVVYAYIQKNVMSLILSPAVFFHLLQIR